MNPFRERPAGPGGRGVPPGESGGQDLSGELYKLFAALILNEAGIRLGPHKKSLLAARLSKRMRALGCVRYHEYYKLVKKSRDERVEMLNAIAINTTNFFREPYHFEFLRDRVMPELFELKAAERAIRVWSAGCSTGEEPYSIAMATLEAMGNSQVSHVTWDVKILASDISTRALNTAAAGLYDPGQIPRGFATELASKYFVKSDDGAGDRVSAGPVVRELIRFRRLNLKEEALPFKRQFDVIFCRNVMIYFDEAMQRHVIENFRRHLRTGGYLFLGHSEILLQREGWRSAAITVYQKTP